MDATKIVGDEDIGTISDARSITEPSFKPVMAPTCSLLSWGSIVTHPDSSAVIRRIATDSVMDLNVFFMIFSGMAPDASGPHVICLSGGNYQAYLHYDTDSVTKMSQMAQKYVQKYKTGDNFVNYPDLW